ncbi:MAG: hypothetical protein PHW31_01440 [Candidatus Pacebacteria bacterium]|nr:hypothetical protein [Candidatus Paceibacterota bacterium]
MRKQSSQKNKKEVIEVMPVITQYNKKETTISYYTSEGKEIPKDCVSKEIVIRDFLTAE